MKILLVEDVEEMAFPVKIALEQNRYTVDLVDNGQDALDYAKVGAYDLILLDIMLPIVDGLTVLQTLRSWGMKTAVLLVSAKSTLHDRIDGLNAGADDYLCKPFSMDELLARVRALLRRGEVYFDEVLTLGNLQLDSTMYTISTPTGSIALGNKEYQLMHMLMRSPRRMFSTEELMSRVWGWSSTADIHVVWTNITYLRRKLEKLEANVYIGVVRGSGYYIAVRDEVRNAT